MVGTSAWGVNAPINYLLAKQMWNPQLDVSAALNEWLQRAYGPGWRHMRALYDELDAKMLAHKETQSPVYKGSQLRGERGRDEDHLRAALSSDGAALPQALAECATETQRQRFADVRRQPHQLHFSLRKGQLIADNSKSLFHRDDTAFAQFLKDMETTFSLYQDGRGIDHGPIWKGEWREP
jgi:hypothetical protein